MSDFIQRFCDACGEPKNDLRNGIEFILRCHCDWERGFFERLKKTVNPTCWKSENGRAPKNISNWNPPIFIRGGGSKFRALITVQKCLAMARLYEFCYKLLEHDKESGFRKYALSRSVEVGLNFFVRGPAGSGRGLLMAEMKKLAAVKDISATPNPGEWALFKNDMIESESGMFTIAEAARVRVTECYANVNFLTLENVRAEIQGRNGPWKFKAASSIDALLSNRQVRPGCMAMTSGDFIGQFGDSFGDKLPEVLTSDKTLLLLMFSPAEADALLKSLQERYERLLNTVKRLDLSAKAESGGSIKDRMSEKEMLDSVSEVLYIEELFPNIPVGFNSNRSATREADSLTYNLSMFGEKWKEQAVEIYKKFVQEKEERSLTFKERSARVCVSVVEGCGELAKKMTYKEMLETGRMMSYACVEKDKLQEMCEKARELRRKMMTE